MVAEDGTVYPQNPPPDPVPELAPVSPGDGYVWVNGYWDWNGADWYWANGYWAPNRVGYVYFGPRFEFVDGRAVYYRSYWAGPGGAREYGYGYARREPPAAFRARPSQQPAVWRAQHNETWHQAPGAATWHGSTAAAQHNPGAEPQRQHTEPALEHTQPQHQGTPAASAQGQLESKGNVGAHGTAGGSTEHGEAAHATNGPPAQNEPAAHAVGPHSVVPNNNEPHGQTPAPSAGGHPQAHPSGATPARKGNEKKRK